MGGLNGYIANLQLLLNQAAAYLDWEALDLTSLNSYLREVLEGLLASITNAATHVMTVTTSIISMFVTLVLAVVFSIYMLAGKGDPAGAKDGGCCGPICRPGTPGP